MSSNTALLLFVFGASLLCLFGTLVLFNAFAIDFVSDEIVFGASFLCLLGFFLLFASFAVNVANDELGEAWRDLRRRIRLKRQRADAASILSGLVTKIQAAVPNTDSFDINLAEGLLQSRTPLPAHQRLALAEIADTLLPPRRRSRLLRRIGATDLLLTAGHDGAWRLYLQNDSQAIAVLLPQAARI